MRDRIVEIASDGRYLHAERGFLSVSHAGQTLGRVPLDDIAAVIGNAHGLTWSNELLVRLAERGAPLVLVDRQHRAVGLLLSLDGHHQQGARLQAQATLTPGRRRALWQRLVQAKLQAQARTLEAFGGSGIALRRLARQVRAGDPDNCEAQGAQLYWPALLGIGFRRDGDDATNAQLNYGYTVLRAATARAIVAAGLHPSLGLHHRHPQDAAALASDLMEPFRPLIDATVRGLAERGMTDLDAAVRRRLVLTLHQALPGRAGLCSGLTALEQLARSLARIALGETRQLDLPGEADPAALRALAEGVVPMADEPEA